MRIALAGFLIFLFSGPVAAASNGVEGQVLGSDGRPVAGALVVAVLQQPIPTPDLSSIVGRARTAPDGRFRIAPLTAGVYGVNVSAPNLPAAFHENVAVGGPPINLQLRGDSFTVTGRVLDVEGRPVSAAEVLVARNGPVQGSLVCFAVAPDGSYTVTVPPGEYEVLPVAVGYSADPQHVTSQSRRLVPLRLERVWPKGAAPEDVIAWVREHAIRLATAEPRHGFADLRSLVPMIGKARVVALGEATHNSREFFLLKHRLLEWLVTEQGFTAFAIEATLPEAFDVDEYVLTGRGDAKKALAGLYFWTWNTEEVLDLIEWMRQWNSNPRHRKIHFYGFDMQSPVRAIKVALEYLRPLAPSIAQESARELALLRSPLDYADAKRLTSPQKAALAAAAQRLLSTFDEGKAKFTRRTGNQAWSLARQHARIVVQHVENLRNPMGGVRDRAMAENALWLLEREGAGGKLVVWAHNGHVQFDAAYEWKTMGAHLHDALADELRVFGFAFNGGEFRALDVTGGPLALRVFTFPPSPAGSLDDVLAKGAGLLAALDLRSLPLHGSVHDWFFGRHETRTIGSGYKTELDTLPTFPVTTAFDVLLFVARTTAARLLPMGDRPAIPVFSEPRNGDFAQAAAARPVDWYVPPDLAAFGYTVTASPASCPRGTSCVHIERLPGRVYGEGGGSVRQMIEAGAFRGKRITLQADVSATVKPGDGEGHLWLRIYRSDLRSPVLVFDSMRDHPITEPSFRTYQVVVDVPQDAGTIEYGAMLLGQGRLDLASVSLTPAK